MRIVASGLLVAALMTSGAAYAGTPGWSVSESSGQVNILSPGLSRVATRGGAIAIGDVIATGTNGRAVLVRGEEFVIVAPNSRLRVADPVKTGGLTQMVEQFGNAVFKIKKMVMPHFAVETPFLAAVVKGTTFSVTVSEKGASVQVIEGRVEVATRDGGATYMVLPGDIGSVSASAPGRLNVKGRENKSIESTGVAGTPGASFSAPAEAVELPAVVPASFDGKIAGALSEGPVRLESVSGGLVSGNSALVAAVASTVAANRTAAVAVQSASNVGTPLPVQAQPEAATPATVVAAVTPAVTPVVAAVTPAVTPVVAAVTPAVTPVVAAVTPAVTPVVAAVTPAVTPVVAAVTPAVTPVVAAVTPAVTPVVAAVTPAVTPVVAAVTPAVTPVVAAVTSAVTPVVAAVTPAVTPVVAAVTPAVTPVVAAVTPVVVASAGNGSGGSNSVTIGNLTITTTQNGNGTTTVAGTVTGSSGTTTPLGSVTLGNSGSGNNSNSNGNGNSGGNIGSGTNGGSNNNGNNGNNGNSGNNGNGSGNNGNSGNARGSNNNGNNGVTNPFRTPTR